ncbi:MAG TPA: TlpA disulfide reductase family protein [Polyangiaceae bacterium]
MPCGAQRLAPIAGACLATLACLAALACLCACVGPSAGVRAGTARALGQPAPPIDWATRMLGAPPRSASVTRPYPGSDSLERDRSPDPSPTDFATFHCRQADGYSSLGADAHEVSPLTGDIVVLHGVPPWLDPSRPYPDRGDAAWTPVETMPSGVRAYRGTRGHHDEPVQLFVLPSSTTWIVATGVAAQRLRWSLASDSTEPPSLDALPGAFSQETFPVDGGEVARSGKCWVRDCTRVVAAGQVLYPPSGRSLEHGAVLFFPDEGTARGAAADARRLLADPATRERLAGHETGDERFVGVRSVGSAVLFLSATGGGERQAERAAAAPPEKHAAPSTAFAPIDDQGVVSMAALRGKVVLVHFWGTWAADAGSERSLESLERLAERYRGAGLEVVGVAEEGDRGVVLRYAHDHRLTFRLTLDADGAIKRSWAPEAFPATYIVDRKGDVRAVEYYLHQGDADQREIETEVQSLL